MLNLTAIILVRKYQTTSSPLGDCVTIGEMVKNVMLNLFQHLMESISYETLKRVQKGDKNEL